MSLNFTDENTLIEQEQQIEIENEQDIQAIVEFENAIARVNASPLHQLLGYDNEHSNEHNEPFGGT